VGNPGSRQSILGNPLQTAQGDLYLVVQIGNAFLSYFPW
jgi:hypothetical protein